MASGAIYGDRRGRPMFRNEHKHTELEDILQELLASSSRPTHQLLAGFVQRYPDFAKEILSFASEWTLQDLTNESETRHEIDEKLSQAKAHSALKDALFRFDRNIKEAGREVEPVAVKPNDWKAAPILTNFARGKSHVRQFSYWERILNSAKNSG